MTWPALIWRNLLRRAARTLLTAVGVGLGVSLIVALLATISGVHRTAGDLMRVGRADFGLYQADASDFPRSLLQDSLARKVAAEPGVAAVTKVKLLVVGGMLCMYSCKVSKRFAEIVTLSAFAIAAISRDAA